METGSRRGDVKAAMTFILGGRADHGRPGPGPTRADATPAIGRTFPTGLGRPGPG